MEQISSFQTTITERIIYLDFYPSGDGKSKGRCYHKTLDHTNFKFNFFMELFTSIIMKKKETVFTYLLFQCYSNFIEPFTLSACLINTKNSQIKIKRIPG